MEVELFNINFWMLINDLPVGFIFEQVTKKIGDFIGCILLYDAIVVSLGYRGCMWICVGLDVWKPLKRKERLSLSNGKISNDTFQYEKLRLFFFFVWKTKTWEEYLPMSFLQEKKDQVAQWDLSIRVPPRKKRMMMSPWLRNESGNADLVREKGMVPEKKSVFKQ
ncbi:hypothetical protein F3Y22_tig00003725pilonHSYRG00046 [Hibiscus syriacus]|uniref:DUF4283 domain-containing protein n=1 Tax=Hibiscus syriacus TaxID=106335 RepID=A0A6A3CKZ6_HIBSY|nr:hypothetical protein F3Y22_tig00003725pilonHSYRG00046 [Hibiscus syriacus]